VLASVRLRSLYVAVRDPALSSSPSCSPVVAAVLVWMGGGLIGAASRDDVEDAVVWELVETFRCGEGALAARCRGWLKGMVRVGPPGELSR
jgi:hypothetical protein